MTDAYEHLALDFLCSTISSGGTPSRRRPEFFAVDGEGHLWVKSKELLNRAIDDTEERITDAAITGSSAKYYPAGTVLLAMYGANVGQLGWLRRPATVNQAVCGLVVNEEVADPRYVLYALLDRRAQLIAQARGAAQQNLSQGIIREFRIPAPALEIQQRIAAVLAAYDDLIESNTRRIAILEKMARSLYEEWFVNFRFPGHESVSMVESDLGPIPEGWSRRKYADLLVSHLGGDWGSAEPNDAENSPTAVVRGTDFKDITRGRDLRVPHRFITLSSLRKRGLEPGDLVVENSVNASTRCVGTTMLVSQGMLDRIGLEAIAASFCKVFRFKDPVLAPLAHLHMRHLIEEGTMARYQHIATNGIGNFQARRFIDSEGLTLPSDDKLLNRMLGVVRDLLGSTHADQTSKLRTIRDFLLPKLVSGEIDVADIDTGVGG